MLITDYRMPDMDGIALAARIHQLYPGTAIIMVTGCSTDALHERAIHASVQHILSKPVNYEDLCGLILETRSRDTDTST